MLHDNARPHSAVGAAEAIGQLKFELLSPSTPPTPPGPHSLHLAPLDDDMFEPLKEPIHGCFATDDEVTAAVHTWLRSHPEIIFADGIRRLVNSYTIAN